METSRDPDTEESGADVLDPGLIGGAGRRARYHVTTAGVIHVIDGDHEAEESEASPMPEQRAVAPLVAAGTIVGAASWALNQRRARRTNKKDARLRILEMDSKAFEKAVWELFSRIDKYKTVEMVGGPGDRGRDVLCRDRLGRLTIVQCKNWKRPVGPSEIRGLKGTSSYERVHKRIMVSTRSLTEDAKQEARRSEIQWIDLDGLVELVTSPRPQLYRWLMA